MERNDRDLPTRGTGRAPALLAAAVALLGPVAFGQQTIESSAYGRPSESAPGGPSSLGLHLVRLDGGAFALRLEGGTGGEPAALMFALQADDVRWPGGGTLLVGAPVDSAAGRFDRNGVWTWPLDEARFAAEGAELFVQGVQPPSTDGTRGVELSGGLVLTRGTEPEPPAEQGPEFPEIIVEEFAGMLRAGELEAALDVALNSKGDALALELGGNLEVPVVPGVTAGGKVKLAASVTRDEDGAGAEIYDLAIGADVAASAGVGVGFAGLGVSSGLGGEVIWRYRSTHEVARALRSMAILQAVGPNLEAACLAYHAKVRNIDRALRGVRRVLDCARSRFRAHMPWRSNALVQRMQRRGDALRAQRRQLVDRARRTLDALIGQVAEARVFLNEHVHGFEQRTTTAAELGAGTGIGDKKNGGEYTLANFGASFAAGLERQFSVRMERVEESEALAVVHKAIFTKSITGAAGLVVGLDATAQRVIELSHRTQVGRDGLQLADSGTTVSVTLDGKVLGALGVVATGRFGVGGEVVAEMRLRDLIGYAADAADILLGDDTDKLVQLLRAVPVTFLARGRYEAGVALGISVDVDGAFKGGIGGSAMLRDRGTGFEYQGGSDDESGFGQLLATGPLQNRDRVMTTYDAVRTEVASVMQR